MEELESHQTRLRTEIYKLTQQTAMLKQQLEGKQGEITQEDKKLTGLNKQQSIILKDIQIKQNQLKALTKIIEDKNNSISALEAGLQFLVILPQVAMAPVWIEVVRLALDKGQIDSLTIQALERLALSCPKEALPLLAEIGARCPDPFKVDTSQIQSAIANWFGLIAESRSLQKKDEIQWC
jgi:hypothetical protein